MGWSRTDVTVTLSPSDGAGSGMAGGQAKTEYSSDGGFAWTMGTSVVVAAPGDHSNDDAHGHSSSSTRSGTSSCLEDEHLPRRPVQDTGHR